MFNIKNIFRKKNSVKGKYIMVFYIDIGNLSDEIRPNIDRLATLNEIENYTGSNLKDLEKQESPATQYIRECKEKYTLSNMYPDIIKEYYIPTRNGSTVQIIKID